MYDAFLKFNQKIKNSENIILEVEPPFILATIHRPENTDNKHKLISIFRELDKINEKTRVVLPLHPRTKGQLQKYGVLTEVQLIAPVGYLSMLSLLNSTEMVITDSGGLQKESFFAKKKCITVRKETEWTELIDIGVNRLSNPEELYDTFEKMNVKKCDFSSKPYGDGNAGNLILDSIVKFISSGIC